jgi:Flp pilus assembly protein TadD
MGMPGFSTAAPFVPSDPSLIVLRVSSDPALQRITLLEVELQTDPDNLVRIYDLTNAYIALGRRTTEPRYFGRAEALLRPRLGSTAAPAVLRLQLADILQYRHEYDSALREISKALAQERGNTRAHLMRAAIWQSSGRFAEARAECGLVLASGDSVAGSVCLAQVMGMTGQIERARGLLTKLDTDSALSLPYASWLLTALADIEERSGDVSSAERTLRRAVTGNPADYYARFALADLLLDRNRPGEVTQVLADLPRNESVLMRLAESQALLHAGKPNPDLLTLTERLDAARARGERLHARDLARMKLKLTGDPTGALLAAKANWNQQHEPVDARLLIRCGLAAHDRSAIEAVREWQRRTSYQDVTLHALLAAAEAGT